MATIPTTKISWPGDPGYLIINEFDYDPTKHQLFDSAPSTPEPTKPTKVDRLNELSAMDWRDIKEVAEGHRIDKPDDGWMEAIPLILEVEYGA